MSDNLFVSRMYLANWRPTEIVPLNVISYLYLCWHKIVTVLKYGSNKLRLKYTIEFAPCTS